MDVMSRVGHGAPEFVLASASPRRLELLQAIGIQPAVRAAAVDERPLEREAPADLVVRLAKTKARTVADGRRADAGPDDAGDHLVVGADTVIDLDGRALGKPSDRAEAEHMLRSLSGRCHEVITGMAVIGRLGGETVEAVTVERTEVTMRSLGEDDLTWYLDTGEFDGKAGAYAIQGFGALLVDGIDGSYHNVVGLSVTGLDRLCREVGLALRDLVTS